MKVSVSDMSSSHWLSSIEYTASTTTVPVTFGGATARHCSGSCTR